MIVDFKLLVASSDIKIERLIQLLIKRKEGWEPQGSLVIATSDEGRIAKGPVFYMPMVKIEPEIIYRESMDDVGIQKLEEKQ